VFCGSLTSGGLRTDLTDGTLRITSEGRHHKFVQHVRQITFNADMARARGQRILYVTERAVFALGSEGPELIEVAPGFDVDDVLALMDFRPKIADVVVEMNPRLFAISRTSASHESDPICAPARGAKFKEN
jgi:acyl CoA:acetate/3-ketoacid CoA transferase